MENMPKIPNANALLWKLQCGSPEDFVTIARLVIPWEHDIEMGHDGMAVCGERTYHIPSLVKRLAAVPVVQGAKSPVEWLMAMRGEIMAEWKSTPAEAAISHEYDETVSVPEAPWFPLYAAFHLGRLFQAQQQKPVLAFIQKKES